MMQRPCMYHIFCITFISMISNAAMEEGDTCNIKALRGTCLPGSKCKTLDTAIQRNIITKFEIKNCGFTPTEELICCPILTATPPTLQTQAVPTTPTTTIPPTKLPPAATQFKSASPVQTSETRSSDRPAVEACRRIEQFDKLQVKTVPHIFGGVRADEGEFPHMAGIGYPVFGRENEYEFSCAGSLIDLRYVLTAAHCVNSLHFQPKIVRLGTINIRTPDVGYADIEIEDVLVHENFTNAKKYDDIAVIKLKEEAVESNTIKRVCLHTENDVVPDSAEYYVTGWGKISLKYRNVSDILLKAQLETVPWEICNKTYIAEDKNSQQLSQGIVEGQLCAQGIQGNNSDACQGDSGGPLNLMLDKNLNTYRVAGIVSAGFSCGNKIPGLYTRVSSYLDYIESIVWPNGFN